MTLCCIYNKNFSYPYIEDLLREVERYHIVEIDSIEECREDFDIYLIDTGELTKRDADKIRVFFKEKQNTLTFLLAPNNQNLLFYQLAYILKVKSVVSQKQNASKVSSIMKTQLQEKQSLYVGNFIVDISIYMVFHGEQLRYASDALMQKFACTTLDDVMTKVCSKLDLQRLLTHHSSEFQSGVLFGDTGRFDIVKSIYKNGEYLLLIERFKHDDILLSTVATNTVVSKIFFIDFLKKNTFGQNIKKIYSLLTLKIVNFKKIGNLIGKVEQEEFIHAFLEQSTKRLNSYRMICEYYNDFFVVLVENVPFEELESQTREFYNSMEEFFVTLNFKVELSLHIVELESVDFAQLLPLLDAINTRSLSKKSILNHKIKYIGRYKDDMSDQEIIELLFDTSFINDENLTLINTYKGVVIESATKILKHDDNSIYVLVDELQGTVMSMEKKSIIRSELFARDIQAHVAYVDKKKHLAKLENLKVLATRLHIDKERVMFAKQNKALLSLVGTKLFAEILDISKDTINLKINKTKLVERLIDKEVTLSFVIPTKRNREQETTLVETVKVSQINCKESEDYCKITCTFNLQSKNKNIIAEYINSRRYEILQELKYINKDT